MTIVGDFIKPQTLSNEGLRNKRAFKGVNIWRGVNTLLPDEPLRFQMVFKCDLRGQSIWPGKHNTFKRVLKLRVVHTLWVTLPNLLLQDNRTSLCSYPHGLPSGTHCWDPWAMRTTFTPPSNAYSSHIKNSLISSPRARDQLSKVDRKTFVWSEREQERRSPLKWLHRGGGRVERNYRTNISKVGRGILFNFVLIKGTAAHQRGGALVNTRLWGKRRGWMDQVGNCCHERERNTPRV